MKEQYMKYMFDKEGINKLRRCTCCILPETMPFIEFDVDGVCNYCRSYQAVELQPKAELEELADKIRHEDGTQDCVVMFSGGRDSSYLLHYIVKVLHLHPLVFTYDWGMSTPIADRNAEKMCEILGVERIIIRKDAERKIQNIYKNVKAWCKTPDLGMVPLFMAGDKQFFLEVNRISSERNLNTIFIGTSPMEKTDFKAGFCGVAPNFHAKHIHSLSSKGRWGMVSHYLRQFIKNPAYINSSLFDSAKAFFAFYDSKQEQINLYKYVRWDEEEINNVLISQYGWETDPDSSTTWRIGDGTAAFYNYIYYYVAGFTENDTLRSNQIREGALTRERALELVDKDNQPRFDSMQWYFQKIGLDMDEVLTAVRKIPRRYISGK